ncbi:HMCN1 [Branchiostoma lanceolatum]|uniref:HMCN1 protein n=2 Tax=Branchiostoma lanceolatum TaxID=7740 RepID=A0A8K0EEF6_BRALA|nr:HMCN1 [Branchiostoma lanceolatum]
MHANAVWVELSCSLFWCRVKLSTVFLLAILPVVLTQTVQKTIPVLEGDDTSVPCDLDLSCDPNRCLLWIYKGSDDESLQVGSCSSRCGSCGTDCPHTIGTEQCGERPAIYFQDTNRYCTAVYQCQLAGTSERYAAKLDVHYPPSKLTFSKSRPIAVQGQPFELSCQTNDLGNPPAKLNLTAVTGGVVTQGQYSSTMRFERVDHRNMARELKCSPTQEGSLVSREVLQNLGVSEPLEIYYPPDSDSVQILSQQFSTSATLHVNIGDRLDLNCTVGESNPPPTISWWRNGVMLRQGVSTLVIEQVRRTDVGEYVCKAGIDVPNLDIHWSVSSDPVTVAIDAQLTTTAKAASPTVTTPHVTTLKTTTTTTEMAGIAELDAQHNSSLKEHQVFTTGELVLICAFGGLMSVTVVVIWVWKRRKTTTSEGPTSDVDPPPAAVGLTDPVQVSSIRRHEQEPNFNPRLPIMVSLKMTTPQQRPVGHLDNPALDDEERLQTLPKVTSPDNTPDRVLHLNEVTPPPKEKARASVLANKRSKCNSTLSLTSTDKATRPKALANARHQEDVRRSVSLDESTNSEPHTLCSNRPDSVSCPLLDEMISEKSVAEKDPKIPRVSTSREGGCEEKRSSCGDKKDTGPKAGLFGSMETITEDTGHFKEKKKTPLGNQNGRESLDVQALSLGGNKVAITIVQMIQKQAVDRGNFGLPYHKFSDLCLRLYNTGNNWKILAGKLGLTFEDVLLIDNCSAQHGLLAAEIVLRHWQRTADQDGMTACNLQNLQDILIDMGRKDLVEMLNK